MSKAYESRKAADDYDFARELPDETLASWMDSLQELVPLGVINQVLDLGGGTGRFARLLWPDR